MKMRNSLILFALLVANITHAQSSAFTYQGSLNDNGGPANGRYDIAFLLHTAATGATQVGPPLTGLNIPVTNGLFTVTLNFGDEFPGADRWLEIMVRTNEGGLFTTLSPRQQIRPTPYATYSTTAGIANSVAATNLSGTIPLAQLPVEVVTNNASGVNFSGTFTGNGADLTGLNAANLTGSVPSGSLTSVPAGNLTGAVADARLSSNVALRSGGNVFSGSQQVVDAVATGAQSVDQQVPTTSTGGNNFVRPWQSFTAGANGLLTAVALYVSSPLHSGNSSGTISIHAGEGTNGTLLATQPVTWISNQFGAFQTNTLTSPPQLQTGNQYTILFEAPVVQKGWVYLNTSNIYAGGIYGGSSGYDCTFKTFMTPGATGQSVLMVNPPGFTGNVGIGTNAPQAKLHVVGDILVSGNINGAIAGNGAGLTNVSASNLTSGTVPDVRLSSNVALRSGGNTFTGNQIISSGNVGIGAVSPNKVLEVNVPAGNGLRITGPGGNGATVAVELSTYNPAQFGSTNPSARIQATDNNFSSDVDFQTKIPGAAINAMSSRLFIGNAGNVGVGTNAPQAKLQVVGDVKLGSTGQYFAPAGEENLRFVRGSVSGAGAVVNGTGFTASRLSNATYLITFTTAFSSPPSIVLSCGAAGQTLSSLDVAVSYNVTATSFNVQTGVRNAGYFDEPFSFIAAGPR